MHGAPRTPEAAVGGAGTVLVVEDDAQIREILAVMLESNGYSVLQAADGREALEVLGREQPEVVLLDLMMPVMSGLDFLEVRARSSDLARVPVIVVSAHPELARGSPGVAQFLYKPLDLDLLLAAVDRHRRRP